MNKLTVVCMLWGNWCKPYGPKYVNNLYYMFQRHLSLPHEFLCFTEQNFIRELDHNIIVSKLDVPDWPLNLKKFYMHCPDNGLKGRILFADLDSVIIGSMDEMASYNGPFCGIKPFREGYTHIGGGLLSFEAGYGEYLWDEVSKDPYGWAERTEGGKERLVYKELVKETDRWQDLYPGQLVGYKRHCRGKKQHPKGARFIAFHGHPRPHEVRDKFIIRNWG